MLTIKVMSKFRIISFLLVFSFAIPAVLFGQEQVVKGKIIKIEDGERKTFNSIPVTLYDLDQESRSSPSITNNNGTYYLYDIPEGEYKLEIWFRGEIDLEDRRNSAETYNVTINYDEAISRENRRILELDPVEINT